MKKFVLAVIAVFIAWSVIDAILHGVILQNAYQQTATLWRPCAEMKTGLMRLVQLVTAITFVAVYALLIKPKGMGVAIGYGLIYGIGAGVGMGYGSYSIMPITAGMASAWFWGSLIESIVAALLVGAIIKE
ncbi:MAG: hypothetical protein P8123_07955 [bacterium]